MPAGRVTNAPIMASDLFATFAAATGAPIPPGAAIDGQNILPILEGKRGPAAARALIWHFPYYHPEGEKVFSSAKRDIGVDDFMTSQTRPHSAIRVGDYKLLRFYENERDELYDLAHDPGEQIDLREKYPDRARELRTQLENYLRSANARFPTRK